MRQLRLPFASRRRRRVGSAPERLDNIPSYGHKISSKGKDCCRVAFQNINGIMHQSQLIGIEELGGMEALEIDALGLLETNINWTHEARESFTTAANLKFRNAVRCTMSSCQSTKQGYLLGGTALVAQGKLCGRIQQRGSDKYGGFSWMALRGKNDTGVIIMNVYRVGQKAGSDAGQDTLYMQQWRAMRADGIKNPDPRNAVLNSVSTILSEWGQKGYHPLVMIDANSQIDEKKFKTFIAQHGLIDLVTDVHGIEPPPTYARGRNRIDHLLGDRHIRRAVVRSGALELHDGIASSDHTMQYVDLDEKLLFGDDSFKPMSGYQREFRLYDVKRKKEFQDKLIEIYQHQKIPDRVNNLAAKYQEKRDLTPEDIQKYQKLDEEIVSAIKAAAASVGRKDFGYQRSEALCAAGAAVRMHKAIWSCIRRGTSFTEKIKTLAEKIGYTLPARDALTHKQAQTNVSKAWRSKRDIEKEDAEH